MSWFSLPWSRKANSRDFRKPRRRFRPAVEILEDRTVPSAVDLFVVPAGTPIDSTHFATLQAALSAGSLAGTSGSVIQIEPGSSPGNIAGLTLPAVQNLTIQGDPNVGLTDIPQFTVSDSSFIVTQNGWILEHLNIGLIQGTSGSSTTNGFLTFSANDTITGSKVENFNSATSSVNFAGTQDTMTNSTLDESVVVATLLTVNLPGPSKSTSNIISGNTFIALSSSTGTPVHVLVYSGAAKVADAVTGNTFIFATESSTANIGLLEQANISGTGLTIQDNTFSTPPTSLGTVANGIEVNAFSVSTKVNILSNNFNFAPPDSSVGILVVTNNGTAAANIVGNDLNINDGNGLGFEVLTNSDIIDAKVQGNDFHDNSGGVAVNFSGTTASLAGIDLGGGSQGSLGGNNFRSFTTSNPNAITTSGSGTVQAQDNIFSVANPSTVVTAGSGTSINTANPLTGTTAFVETLYIDYLHRAGAASELAGWANSGLSQGQIANDIIRSQEPLTNQVDALYLKILGRPADSGGQSFFVNLLQHGGTLEQVMVDMFASGEYAADTGSDGAFIQSLYNKILGRVGDNGGVAFWLGQLPSLGRAAVASGFLNSTEFRGDAVEQLYGDPLAQAASVASLLPDLLHRTAPPSSAEIAAWVNSGLDLLSLQAALAGSSEFFTNG